MSSQSTCNRKSRWGPQAGASIQSHLPTAITAAMTPEQLDAYVAHLRIQEITQTLLTPSDDDDRDRSRSSSPPPEYDGSGRRTNTRQARRRQRLQQERARLVTTASHAFAHYQAPRDIRANPSSALLKHKVYIPTKDFPGLNFIGQILGPRGHGLRHMEVQSRAKIAIRGRGSVKEGRGRTTNDDLQEPLHCLIIADQQDKVDSATELINSLIETIISSPEDQNTRKRDQLRQLATTNGTFRDDEGLACRNCGQLGHRHHTCPEPAKQAAHVQCHLCHNSGHIARDCLQGRATGSIPSWRRDRLTATSKVPDASESEREFDMLMAEIAN